MATPGSSSPATGFDKELAEALISYENPSKLKFSPNGEKIVYATQPGSTSEQHLVGTLWLASAKEPLSSRQLTTGLVSDRDPNWHPDGNQIAFLSDRSKLGSLSVIYGMRLDGGDAFAITPTENTQDIETWEFSPSGKTIAYISADEKDKKDDEDEDESTPNVWGEGWEFARLRIVDLETKKVKLLVGGDRNIVSLAWSPDGSTIAFESVENTNIEEVMLTGTTISTVQVETGKVRDLCKVPMELNSLTWAPDGWLYFLSDTVDGSESGGSAVYNVNPAADSPKYIKVAHGVDDDAHSITVAGGQVVVNRDVRLTNVISELGGDDLFNKNKEIWTWDVYIPKTGNPTLAAALSSVNTAPEVFIVEEGRDDIQLSTHGKRFEGRSFGSSTVLTCQSADGEVELDGLYFTPTSGAGPDGKPKEPLPTFVLIHGGPKSHDTDSFDTSPYYWAPFLLSKGYGVLFPQYRGSSGRGEKFSMYSVGGQGKYDYADVVSITDNAIKLGFADPKRLIVGGWSQGGLLTYLCSVRNGLHDLGWRFNAGVAGAGVCDVESNALTADLGSTNEVELNGGETIWTLSRDDTRLRQGSALWEVADAVKESARRGEPVIPPMLILHGEDDDRCPFSQAEGFRRALRAHKLPCEFVAYPGQGHSIGPRRFQLDMLERIGRWCDTYFGSQGVEAEVVIR